MEKLCLLTLAVSLVLTLACVASAEECSFKYPCYLLDAYDADNSGWKGVGVNGVWPVPVIPENWLIGPPPAECSAVTLPPDHWVELKFRGKLVDGPGDDILLVEWGTSGERALIFVTDGAGQEYLLGMGTVGTSGMDIPTEINFNMPDILLPFVPSAVRVLGITMGGGSPGFDLGNVRMRTCTDCCEIACNPSPIDGAKNVAADAVLSWSPGCFTDEHIIYFGSSLDDVVANATPVSTQPLDANSFNPCGLDFGQTYYWRIDEFNDPCVWQGDIWSFTVNDCLVVEDFESYDDTSNPIDDTWIASGDAYITLWKVLYHSCWQSMSFSFYCDSSCYSEATRTFSPPQDWASAGFKILELFFHGESDNTFEPDSQMYFAIDDGNIKTIIPFDSNETDIKNEVWQLQIINLQNLSGVNLSNVESISIGFRVPIPESYNWGMGTVYFDDIRLCLSRCLQDNRPQVDFSGDCIVDFEDLEELAYSWLDKRHNIYPVVAPNAPLAWFEFENNANDSSGNGYNGNISGSPTYAPGVYGKAINFDGDDDSVAITNAVGLFSRISTGITIAFWQYGAVSPHRNDTVCCSNYTYGGSGSARPIIDAPAVAINLGCWKAPGRYNWDCGHPWSFDNRLSGSHRYQKEWSGQWNHWAFTKDAQTGTMQIFLNGLLYDSRTDANSPISAVTSFQIGSGWYGGYDGLIDDFRIYDYALSQPEIAHVATNGTGIFDIPLMSPADLFTDDLINFRDFAILADSWLEEQLWP